MKQKSLLTFLIATAMIGSFSACVDSEKDLRDGSFQMPNPMGEGFAAPEDMDWNMISDVKVSVDVEDQFDGKYFYVVELYDANPIITENAHLLSKGTAKKGQPFKANIAIPNIINTIYVKTITPEKLSTVRAIEVSHGEARHDLNAAIGQMKSSTRSLAVTRGSETPENVNADDASLFPTEIPADAVEFPSWEYKSNAKYKVTSSVKSINIGGSSNIALYVIEDIHLRNLSLTKGSRLYILPGKKVTIDASDNSQSAIITVGKGATVTFNAETAQLSNSFKLYNAGILNARTLMCTGSSIFYNLGTAKFDEKLSGESENVVIVNEGTINGHKIDIKGSRILNYDTGIVEVEDTELDYSASSWENDGKWITHEMDIKGKSIYINRCYLEVEDDLDLEGTHLVVDKEAYVRCKELKMERSQVDLGAKALFKITEKAEFEDNKKQGFTGIGEEKALLVIAKVEKDDDNMIYYSGKLQILCSHHSGSDKRWSSSEVEWVEDGKPTISINPTKCNGGASYNPQPETPSEPNYPIETTDNQNYTYLFEDQWPVYGDYDMNDAVLTITHRKLKTNKENKVTKFELSIDLEAVGATKLLSAALMLDEVPANAITQAVRFEGNIRPTSFSLNAQNIENGQDKAVIPLFDNAHQKLGLNRYEPINTISGSQSNTQNTATINFSIEFNNPTLSPEAFNVNKLNVFIIAGGNKNNRREIHIAGFAPSKLAETDIFGNNDDRSSLSSGKYYLSRDNLAWGIIVPTNFKWPLEYTKIQDAYSKFEKWVTSGGKEETNWWADFKEGKVFQTNKN